MTLCVFVSLKHCRAFAFRINVHKYFEIVLSPTCVYVHSKLNSEKRDSNWLICVASQARFLIDRQNIYNGNRFSCDFQRNGNMDTSKKAAQKSYHRPAMHTVALSIWYILRISLNYIFRYGAMTDAFGHFECVVYWLLGILLSFD